jgi:hypothetical protein
MKKPSEPSVDVAKLPFRSRNEWLWRWVWKVDVGSSTLHRLVGPVDINCDAGIATGTAGCGLKGSFEMPGGGLAQGARRCPQCCDAVGVARGRGAPFNHGENEPGCQGPAKEKGKP